MVGEQPKEVTFLHDDTFDLIMSADPSDLCFAESNNRPMEDGTVSKTILNGHPELNQELGLDLTPEDPGELEPLSGGVVSSVLEELFPGLNPNQMTAKEEEATRDVVNKTVRTEGDQQQKTRGEDLYIKPKTTKDDTPRLPRLSCIHSS